VYYSFGSLSIYGKVMSMYGMVEVEPLSQPWPCACLTKLLWGHGPAVAFSDSVRLERRASLSDPLLAGENDLR